MSTYFLHPTGQISAAQSGVGGEATQESLSPPLHAQHTLQLPPKHRAHPVPVPSPGCVIGRHLPLHFGISTAAQLDQNEGCQTLCAPWQHSQTLQTTPSIAQPQAKLNNTP